MAKQYLSERRHVFLLTWLCAGVYFTSYLTRINYKAVISAIVESEGIAKQSASIVLTGLFITYGVGQIISGWLGDRIRPKYLMFGGLLVATLMNVLLPLSTNTAYMLVIWCVNGLGQAMMWPPIVKTLTTYLSPEDYLDANIKVSWGSCFGTIVIYLVAPLFIRFTGWRAIFAFSAVCGAIGSVFCFVGLSYIERIGAAAGGTLPVLTDGADKPAKAPRAKMPKALWGIIALIVLAILCQGSLRDGVDTWMPSYISETFGFETSTSILTGVLLPVFSLLCYKIAAIFYTKVFHNELLAAGAIYGIAIVAATGLEFLSRAAVPNAVITVLTIFCFLLLVGSMHGVNLVLTSFVPNRFRKLGNVSTLSGILNFSTYAGSAISTYGFAVLSEQWGWSGTILLWIGIGAVGAAFCLCTVKKWGRFVEEE